jgi:hypothetical protein
MYYFMTHLLTSCAKRLTVSAIVLAWLLASWLREDDAPSLRVIPKISNKMRNKCKNGLPKPNIRHKKAPVKGLAN